MQCKICGAPCDDPQSGGICPACRQKLQLAATSSGAIFKTPVPEPIAAAPRSRGSAPVPAAREIWRSQGAGDGSLTWPISVALHPSGEILVLDQPENYRIVRFDRQGRCLGTMLEITEGSEPGEITDPQGLCIAASGQIFIPDAGNDRVAIWNADGSFLTTWGRTGSRPGQMAHPADVDVDDDGFAYVADTFNHRIQKFTPDGLFCLEIRDLGAWGRLGEPVAVMTDADHNIFVLDCEHACLVKLSADGVPLSRLPAADASQDLFEDPVDVQIGHDGSVYVGDRRNLRIRRFAQSSELLGTIDLSSAEDVSYEGGDIALLDDYVLVPDRLNDRLVCMAFGNSK
jgi:DNA-binding beta-propeller fold protein YncE